MKVLVSLSKHPEIMTFYRLKRDFERIKNSIRRLFKFESNWSTRTKVQILFFLWGLVFWRLNVLLFLLALIWSLFLSRFTGFFLNLVLSLQEIPCKTVNRKPSRRSTKHFIFFEFNQFFIVFYSVWFIFCYIGIIIIFRLCGNRLGQINSWWRTDGYTIANKGANSQH
jgi:hypothetical protein